MTFVKCWESVEAICSCSTFFMMHMISPYIYFLRNSFFFLFSSKIFIILCMIIKIVYINAHLIDNLF